MIDFTILFASRGRPALLKECISSFYHKAEKPERIEFWIAFDIDDPTVEEVNQFIQENNYNVCYIRVPRSEWLHRDYHNRLIKLSRGSYLIGACDEAEIVQLHWDRIIRDRVEEYLLDKPDRVCYIYLNDSTHVKGHPLYRRGSGYPAFTREAVEAAGCFIPDEIPMWGGDTSTFDIYNSLSERRILWLDEEIQILHKSAHNGTRAADGNMDRNRRISCQCPNLSPEGRAYYIERLNKAINSSFRKDCKALEIEDAATTSIREPMFTGAGWESFTVPNGRRVAGGIPFKISHNAIVLNGPHGEKCSTFPAYTTLECNQKISQIHLLGCVAGWGWKNGLPTSSVIVRVHYEDSVEDHMLYNGKHIADLLRGHDVPESHYTFSDGNKQVRYLTLPIRAGFVKNIEFINKNNISAPLFLAVSVTLDEEKATVPVVKPIEEATVPVVKPIEEATVPVVEPVIVEKKKEATVVVVEPVAESKDGKVTLNFKVKQ
jgi:hypothetical protein